MDTTVKKLLWQQFGGAMDMLNNAIDACPDEVWSGPTKLNLDKYHEYWYMVYHTLFWLDLYLSENGNEFHPHAPYTLSELDGSGLIPDRVYTKAEMKQYLEHCREKCRLKINSLTEEDGTKRFIFENFDLSILELQFYNMRHVQHHSAQLNLILRQTIDSAPRWVRRTKAELNK